MGTVVNLKRFKKRIERDEAAQESEANRARYGQTKSERTSQANGAQRANDLLEQHRIDGRDAS
jgi:Domain of unknown function (DUF4169)